MPFETPLYDEFMAPSVDLELASVENLGDAEDWRSIPESKGPARECSLSQGLGNGFVFGSEGARVGSGGLSLMSVRTLGGVMPFDTISMTSWKDWG